MTICGNGEVGVLLRIFLTELFLWAPIAKGPRVSDPPDPPLLGTANIVPRGRGGWLNLPLKTDTSVLKPLVEIINEMNKEKLYLLLLGIKVREPLQSLIKERIEGTLLVVTLDII